MSRAKLKSQAENILRRNYRDSYAGPPQVRAGCRAENIPRKDYRDGYTPPNKDIYPFQWNWDSATHALAWQVLGEEQRAWREVDALLDSRWRNGMLPHIVFHEESESYFPGPNVWGVKRTPPTSAISQPPLMLYAILHLYLNSPNRQEAKKQLARLYPALLKHLSWWYNDRWDEDISLVFTVHPWESGCDNSPAFDEPLARVTPVEREYQRRDTTHVDTEQRPHKAEYDRYLALVDFYKRVKFKSATIARDCEYRVCDITVNSVLGRATGAVLEMAQILGKPPPPHIWSRFKQLKKGFENVWSEKLQTYCCYDLVGDKLLEAPSAAGFFSMFSGAVPYENSVKMAAEIERWVSAVKYACPVYAPDDSKFEPRRYWRGPTWVIANWLIATGLKGYGHAEVAERLRHDSEQLIDNHGFYEYYNPLDGSPYGGNDFSLPAAVALWWFLR